MPENKITIRISDKTILDFINRNSRDKNIPVSRFIKECLRKCYEMEDHENELAKANIILAELSQQNESLIYSNEQIIKFVSCIFATSSIALQGRINEYEAKNLDPYKYYTRDISEISEMYNFPVKISGEDTE